MNESLPDNAVIKRIVEMQEESEEDDETQSQAFCQRKTRILGQNLLYSRLKEINSLIAMTKCPKCQIETAKPDKTWKFS